MIASTRTPFSLLLCLGFFATASATAGPADELLPPPVRRVEKRSLGGMDDNFKTAHFDGRGGVGTALSPDGKLLLPGPCPQGHALEERGAGPALRPIRHPS